MEYVISALGLFGLFIVFIVSRIIGSLAASEIRDYAEDWAGCIAVYAARRLPPSLAIIKEEEWLADLSQIKGRSSKIIFAIGLFRASFSMPLSASMSNRLKDRGRIGYTQRILFFMRVMPGRVVVVVLMNILIGTIASYLSTAWMLAAIPIVTAFSIVLSAFLFVSVRKSR